MRQSPFSGVQLRPWPGEPGTRPDLPWVGVHTKAVVDAFGPTAAVGVLRAAGVRHAVAWTGERGQHLDFVRVARDAGLDTLALALPRYEGPLTHVDGWLAHWIAAADRVGAPALSLTISGPIPSTRRLGLLVELLDASPLPIIIENSSRREDATSQMSVLSRLLSEAPAVRLALDIGHAAVTDQDLTGLPVPPQQVAWVEVHDNDARQDRHWPLGRGTGQGDSLNLLRQLPFPTPGCVIETDPRNGADPARWVSALSADHTAVIRAAATVSAHHGS